MKDKDGNVISEKEVTVTVKDDQGGKDEQGGKDDQGGDDQNGKDDQDNKVINENQLSKWTKTKSSQKKVRKTLM